MRPTSNNLANKRNCGANNKKLEPKRGPAGDKEASGDGQLQSVNSREEEDDDPHSRPLTTRERKFLLAIERGNIGRVKRLVENVRDDDDPTKKPAGPTAAGSAAADDERDEEFDINCTDPLGRSALVIAIENENIELLMYLLEKGVRPKDALLHSIEEEYVEGVEVLLDFEEYHHKPGEPYSWEIIDDREASWTPDVTPLILAAHKNNYEILKILLDRGATLPMPHDVKCSCDECMDAAKNDSLRHSRSRINAYTALASPSLIALSSKDPLLTAFELSWELRRLSRVENEFKCEYTDLRRQVQKFAVDLLDHARTSRELEIMLNYNPEELFETEDGEKMSLDRLKLAIDYKQKEFVAHANVQQLLTSLWYDGMPGFRRKSVIGQGLETAKIGAMFPIFCINYLLAPHTPRGSKLKQPFIKFLVNSSSYMFFLFLLVIVSQRVENMVIRFLGTKNMVKRLEEWEKQDRGALPSYVESLIILYVFGFVWAEVKQLWDAGGMLSYAQDMWNFVDFAINFFYCAWIGLRLVSWVVVQREIAHGFDPYIPREKWDAWDPMLLSEGVFGAGTIFSILRLVHIFSINHHLGPLQISLGRMIYDVMKFFFFFVLVIFAFGCGMNQLLWYYADIDRELCYKGGHIPDRDNEEHSCTVWRRFANPFETSQSLFWASFGLIDLNNFELTGIKSFTRFWAMLMFGSYSTINVVVLLNLLIAMMSNSFSGIVGKADIEWKFARTKLWISYFEDGGTLPPPFNIIPSPKSVANIFGCGGVDTRKRESIRRKKSKEKEKEHMRVMKCMVKRYVTVQQRQDDDNTVTEDDVNEIKSEVSTFKYQLFDLLSKNGWKVEGLQSEDSGLGRRERTKERRLLKGFNIGLVEGVNFEVVSDRSSANALAKIIMKVTKRGSSKRDWNQIVAANAPKLVDPIGNKNEYMRRRTMRRGNSKLRRESILPTCRGWKRVANLVNEGGFKGGRVNSVIIKTRVDREKRHAVATAGWAKVGKLSGTGAFKRYDSKTSKAKNSKKVDPGEEEAKIESGVTAGPALGEQTSTTARVTVESEVAKPMSSTGMGKRQSSMEKMSGILKSSPSSILEEPSPAESSIAEEAGPSGLVPRRQSKKRISFGKSRLPPMPLSPEPPVGCSGLQETHGAELISTTIKITEAEKDPEAGQEMQEIKKGMTSAGKATLWPGEARTEQPTSSTAASGVSSSGAQKSSAFSTTTAASDPASRWKARDDAWL